jgi:hypothetical protein
MTTIGKDLPVRSGAFRFSSEKRASSAATSPALTECFDIFSAEPGDSDVISQMERLSSKEMKIAARLESWLRHQPQSALALWFKERVNRNGGRLKKTTIVALARKLLVALWKYVTAGVVIEGAP